MSQQQQTEPKQKQVESDQKQKQKIQHLDILQSIPLIKKSKRDISIYDEQQFDQKLREKYVERRKDESNSRNPVKAMDVQYEIESNEKSKLYKKQMKKTQDHSISYQKQKTQLSKQTQKQQIPVRPQKVKIHFQRNQPDPPPVYEVNQTKEEQIQKENLKKSKVRKQNSLSLQAPIAQNSTPHVEQIQSQQPTPLSKSVKSVRSVHSIQSDKTNRRTRQTFRSSHSSCQDYVSFIFTYYCKLSYPIGKNPTFSQIQQKVNIMCLTNFMLFCRDFKLRQQMERDQLVQIFKKHALYHKYLDVDMFKQVVKAIAEIMFKANEQDRRYGKMLVFLGLHNSVSFLKRMNLLGVNFRMKNRRGVQVSLFPKYTFKLTPNNGKDQQQIKLQVKQRTELRNMIKKQQIQWHKNNRMNKIDKINKICSSKRQKQNKNYSKTDNSSIQINQSDLVRHQKIGKIISNRKTNPSPVCQEPQVVTNDQQLMKQQSGRLTHGYYNPCQILTQRTDNSYIQIHQLKKQYLLKSQNTNVNMFEKFNRVPQSYVNHLQQCSSMESSSNPYSKILNTLDNRHSSSNSCNFREKERGKQFKVNNVITMAKNALMHEQQQICGRGNAKSKNYHNISSISAASTYAKAQCQERLQKPQFKHIGVIKRQHLTNMPICSPKSTQAYKILSMPRGSRQIAIAQHQIQSQIRNITNEQENLIEKSRAKEFLRATAKIDKQNRKEIQLLEEMIGVTGDDQDCDSILDKFYSMERIHQFE